MKVYRDIIGIGDKMNDYLEIIFLENLIVNYVLLYMVNVFTKMKAKKIKLIVSDIVSTVYTTTIIVLNMNDLLLKLFLIIFIVYITYQPKTLKLYLKIVIYYLFLSYLYSGIIIGITLFFNVNIQYILSKILVYLISAILLYLLNSFMWKMWKTNIKKEKLTYIINIQGQEIHSFVDTGNVVKNLEYHLDVIFLDKKWFPILKEKGVLKEKVETNINSIIGKSVIPGYIIRNIEVYKNGKMIHIIKKIIISFSEQSINIDGKYTALIGYNTYLENLEGVHL